VDKGNRTAVILGNGESRIGFDYRKEYPDAFVYGCNGAYREEPEALICTDVYMQHLIYKTGYCKDHLCYFSEWDPIPEEVVDAFLRETFGQIIQNERTKQAVISGNEEYTYITWVQDEDMVKSMPEMEISSGSRALLRAAESGWFNKIILIGFDGIGAENVYQNEEGYERSTPRAEWSRERMEIMHAHPEILYVQK